MAKERMTGEVSGAFGDLGTFLPHVLSVITVAGFKPAGIFTLFGIFYLFTGLFYRMPVPVQPMKVASAAVLTGRVTSAEVAGATLVVGVTLLVLGVTGVIGYFARKIPRAVVSGVQLGLGGGLALLGLAMVGSNLPIGLLTMTVMLPVGLNRRLPQAVTGVVVGILAGLVLGKIPDWPELEISLQFPSVSFPAWRDIWHGTIKMGLPQLSLTLTNAVIVTATLAQRLFPGNRRASSGMLALTQGAANLVSGLLGGFPMCHGAGGLAAHHRFGARTGGATMMIGVVLLATGLWFGDAALALLRVVPEASLGALLFYGAADLAIVGWSPESRRDILVSLTVAVLAVSLNPALAIIVGLILFHLLEVSLLPDLGQSQGLFLNKGSNVAQSPDQ